MITKYFVLRRGAPPRCVLAGRCLGEVPLPLDVSDLRAHEGDLIRLLKNGFVMEVDQQGMPVLSEKAYKELRDSLSSGKTPPLFGVVAPDASDIERHVLPPVFPTNKPVPDPRPSTAPHRKEADIPPQAMKPAVAEVPLIEKASPSADVPEGLLDGSVAMLRGYVGEVEDIGLLVAIEQMELAGKARKGAISALRERLAELQEVEG